MRREVAQDESEIRALIRDAAEAGELPATVNQYGAFGRLTVAVARDTGVGVAHITPRKFKQVAETNGEGKSDAKDTFIIAEVFEAISSQTVALPAGEAVERQARKVAARIVELDAEEAELNAELERLSESIPEVAILRSVPGVGRVYGTTIAAEMADVTRFRDAAHLASYAGVAPVKEPSGTSVDKKKRMGGNRRPKNAMIRSAQCALPVDERAATYYEKKRAEGKGHKHALRALARRRIDAIYALLGNGTFYEAQHTTS